MKMNYFDDITRRAKRLGVDVKSLCMQADLEMLKYSISQGRPDPYLYRGLDERMTDLEFALLTDPFVLPPVYCGLDEGDIEIGKTVHGMPVTISYEENRPNRVIHQLVSGSTGLGKSFSMAVIASQVASLGHDTMFIDSTGCARHLPIMRNHRIIRIENLRLNPFEHQRGVYADVANQIYTSEFAENYEVIYGRYELEEILRELREEGKPVYLDSVIHALKNKTYKGINSRRFMYRDTALLNLQHMRAGFGETFECLEGMPIEKILEGNTVLEVDSLLPEHQAFLIRWLFVQLDFLRPRRHGRLLIVFLDEGQVLFFMRNFAAKQLTLRRKGIRTVIGCQNASTAPVEIAGNCDGLYSFACLHEKDKHAVSNMINLNLDQKAKLATLNRGQCVCRLTSSDSNWNEPFLLNVTRLERQEVDDFTIQRMSHEAVKGFHWKPIPSDSQSVDLGESVGDQQVEAFIADVVNQTHEFSGLTQRFQRAGIRSGQKQGSIIRDLINEGLIRIYTLAVGRGRPIKLTEPTPKLLEEKNVRWKTTRGVLPTRAATQFVYQKIKKLDGWQCTREGRLGEKQVDLLCRDSENRCVTIEIAHSHSHEVHNALHCLRSGGDELRRYIVICTTRQTMVAVKKKFSEFLELSDEKVEVITLAKALSEDWMP